MYNEPASGAVDPWFEKEAKHRWQTANAYVRDRPNGRHLA